MPSLDEDGRLPAGRWPVTLQEVAERFVEGSPFTDERRLVWLSAVHHMGLMRRYVGPCTAWVNGGFITRKDWEAPHDVDIVYIAPYQAINEAYARDSRRYYALVTLQDVIVGKPIPGGLDRVQPIGGDVDAFLIPSEDPAALAYFDGLWSAVKGPDGERIVGAVKGYAEVELP